MEAKLTVDVAGVEGLSRKVLQQLRIEVADAIRRGAAEETDGRVVARLNSIAAEIDGSIGEVEGRLAAQNPNLANESRRARTEMHHGLG